MASPPRPSFLFGLSMPVRAAALIVRSPVLLMLSVLPLVVAVVVGIWLGTTLGGLVGGAAMSVESWMGVSPEGLAGTALTWIGRLAGWLGATLLLPFLTTLAAVPVNDFLAEATESRASPPLQPAPSPTLAERVRGIVIDLVKSLAAVVAMLAAALLALVPGAQIVALPLLWLVFTFQVLSYPQTRRGEDLAAGVRFLRVNLAASLGFGLAFSALSVVPLLSHLVPPLAVVGGTLLYARATPGGRQLVGSSPAR